MSWERRTDVEKTKQQQARFFELMNRHDDEMNGKTGPNTTIHHGIKRGDDEPR